MPPTTGTLDVKAPAIPTPKDTPGSRMINPGSFFQLNEYVNEDDFRIVMAMAPESSSKNGKEVARYTYNMIDHPSLSPTSCVQTRKLRLGLRAEFEVKETPGYIVFT